jgi:hypothetical protein
MHGNSAPATKPNCAQDANESELRRSLLAGYKLERPFKCPEWLDDYRRFHNKQRGAANATYLVQYMPPASFSSGLGKLISLDTRG